MASSTSFTLPFFLLLPFILSLQVSSKIILEDGYTVATIIDGHKLKINPHSVLPQYGSSDLLILDSVSSVFYTIQFPISQDSVVRRFSGDGSFGYSDGDVGSAQFNKPKSFAVDFRGNVYVADRSNHVIRKISSSGVTTIAGGLSQKSGNKDGPAQNATFSDDFELAFVPGKCTLLVSDHGNGLVRQIDLKEEDCTLGSKSGLGAVMTWTLGLGLSCLLGIIIGFVVRPFILPHEGSRPLLLLATWKRCLINLAKKVPTLCYAIKSAAVSSNCSSLYALLKKLWRLSLSHLLLMFKINRVASPRSFQEPVPLIDLDSYVCGEVVKSSKYDDQMKDLISYDEGHLDATNKVFNESCDIIKEANMGFVEAPKESLCNYGLVKRR